MILYRTGEVETNIGNFSYKIYKIKMSKKFKIIYNQISLKYKNSNNKIENILLPTNTNTFHIKEFINNLNTENVKYNNHIYKKERQLCIIRLELLDKNLLDFCMNKANKYIQEKFNQPLTLGGVNDEL